MQNDDFRNKCYGLLVLLKIEVFNNYRSYISFIFKKNKK